LLRGWGGNILYAAPPRDLALTRWGKLELIQYLVASGEFEAIEDPPDWYRPRGKKVFELNLKRPISYFACLAQASLIFVKAGGVKKIWQIFLLTNVMI